MLLTRFLPDFYFSFFQSNEEEITSVSVSDVANVCASALTDPGALNKSFYITKSGGKQSTPVHEQFTSLPTD